LLTAGANINACAPAFATPLVQATINHRYSTVRLLLQHGADPNVSICGNTAMFWAKDARDNEAIGLLHNFIGARASWPRPGAPGRL
jgi:ankyrin repeat protein